MSACCVPGCKNRHCSTSKLKFYRIPSGYRPFQANRRRLWLQAIKQVDGSAEGVKSNARICGAHFISGEASLDHDSPDFVPSVFTCSKPKPSPKKKGKRLYRRRRRRRRKLAVETREKTTPPGDDSSMDLQSSVLMETESKLSKTIQTPSDTSVPKEAEPLSKETEATSSPKKPLLFFQVSADNSKLDRMSPVVLLKPVIAPAGGFRCELCSQNFISVLELVKHKRKHDKENTSVMCEICGKCFTSQADFTEHQHLHADEPSFPCNMCERSFTTSHNLKRHKLLHVKDGRKCPKCGVLFCRRHNHVLFLPNTDNVSKSEQGFTIIGQRNDDSDVASDDLEEKCSPKPEPETRLEEKCILKPECETRLEEKCSPKPERETILSPSSSAHTSILSEIPVPLLQKTSTVPCPRPPVPRYSWPSRGSSKFKAPLCSPRAALIQPPPPQFLELPASLQLFSPQYLTSALFEVKRNYEYILNKPEKIKKEMKEEQVELPLISPDEQSVEEVKNERIAYDLEIIL